MKTGAFVKRDVESLVAGGAVLGISALLFTQMLSGHFSGVELARNPMTFPRFLLTIFALGGVGMVLRGWLAPRMHKSLTGIAWGRLLAVLVLAGLYLAVFAPLGFLPATLIILPTTIFALGYRRVVVIFLVTLITVVGLWYAFAEIFSIRPPGIGMDDIFRAIGRNR
mgnify:CR=1 FL=1